jgi:glycosyltransferase involved in cell wall biosynthesis
MKLDTKRILIISALYPPDVIGGAEMSAAAFAQWLKKKGAQVGVITTAKTAGEVCDGKSEDGITIWRYHAQRPYPLFHFLTANKWLKPLWHLLDHFAPSNRTVIAQALDSFKPDFVNIHVLQGIGYNALLELAKRDIPTLYTLHDMGLACIRMSMFKNGAECKSQCTLCASSTAYKAHLAALVPRLGYCSPSRANLEKLAQFFPVRIRPHTAIMNPNAYPVPRAARIASKELRILFVGRLHSTKGVHLLLETARRLSEQYNFKITIVGSGPDEAMLRDMYGAYSWCHFTGFINQVDISNIMMNSDVLCVPSLWLENSPGVIIHALGLGLPVIGSNKGGIPELVDDDKNGALFDVENADGLYDLLKTILLNPERLIAWRDYGVAHAEKFNQDHLGQQIISFMEKISLPR